MNAVTASTVSDIAAPHLPSPSRPRADEYTRATRFFWTVLILATAASIGGNVTHAVLKADSGPLVAVAAAVAMVPPSCCWPRRIRWVCWCGRAAN